MNTVFDVARKNEGIFTVNVPVNRATIMSIVNNKQMVYVINQGFIGGLPLSFLDMWRDLRLCLADVDLSQIYGS